MGPVRRGALYQTRSHCFTFSGATSLRLNSRTPQKIRSRTAIGSAYTFFTTGLGRGSPIIIVPAEKLGFWQVETSSLRDFPQQFRTFEILRNNDDTISILATNVDPAVRRCSKPLSAGQF
jgi:hypothetical protein